MADVKNFAVNPEQELIEQIDNNFGYIYLITNKINGKRYVGKTETTVEARWKRHLSIAKNPNAQKYAIHQAILKYGAESFIIKEIEKVPTTKLSQREQYWIQYYNSYKRGYNETLGGDGNTKYNYLDIYEYYNMCRNTTATAEHFNCDISVVLSARRHFGNNPTDYFVSEDKIEKIYILYTIYKKTIKEIAIIMGLHEGTISYILKNKGMERFTTQLERQAKPICCMNILDGEIIKEFPSIRAAARWLGNINFAQNIGACCKHRQKTAYGYIWKYKTEIEEKVACL